MTTIEILAVIGGITVIRTAAAKIPAALADLIRACIPVADAARDLHAAINRRASPQPARASQSRGR